MGFPRNSILTPWRVAAVARVVLIAQAPAIAWLYLYGPINAIIAAMVAYALVVALLLALPRSRSSDIAAYAALFMSIAEFAGALDGHPLDLWRWLTTMAAIGTIIVPLRTQRMRGLMLQDGWRPLSDFDRRRRKAPIPADPVPPPQPGPVDQALLPAPPIRAA